MQYETVIGLEVHAQLKTKSKIFCNCSTTFGSEPNTQVCPVCLGMPGVLPVLNSKALEFAVKTGMATNCTINEHSLFARKNYFYPDLPKGYQISQFENPICENGFVEIELEGQTKAIGLIRIHLEEDAGKSVHAEEWVPEGETLIDLNRCGTPLMEIVSQPDIRSPKEAFLYLTQLKSILEYLDVSDCNMEEGSLRCDANVSIRPQGSSEFGVKTEVKNMNSFHGVEKALEIEVERQKNLIERGDAIIHQTLLWNAKQNKVTPMRSKEEANDYRYFLEPDLVPLQMDKEWLHQMKETIPELPLEKKNRFIKEYGICANNADVLVSSLEVADFFEATSQLFNDAKFSCNFILSAVLRYLGEKKTLLSNTKLTPKLLAELLNLVKNGTISLNIARKIFTDVVESGISPSKLIEQKGLSQVSDESELLQVIKEVLDANPGEVQKFLDGKEQVIGFFVGQVMKATKGQANPKIVNPILRKQLAEIDK